MHYLSPDHEHPHPDEPEGPGSFEHRHAPLARDFRARAFTIGIGGPVGSGKTALLLRCAGWRMTTTSRWLRMTSSRRKKESSWSGIRRPPIASWPLKQEAALILLFVTISARIWTRWGSS